MADEEKMRAAAEVRRVFELLDNVNTCTDKGDTFKHGLQVGKLMALGWVLREVTSSDISLSYEFDDWQRDIEAQQEGLKRQLGDLQQLLDDDSEQV